MPLPFNYVRNMKFQALLDRKTRSINEIHFFVSSDVAAKQFFVNRKMIGQIRFASIHFCE